MIVRSFVNDDTGYFCRSYFKTFFEIKNNLKFLFSLELSVALLLPGIHSSKFYICSLRVSIISLVLAIKGYPCRIFDSFGNPTLRD